MPTVSINLSPKAYQIYAGLTKQHRSSAVSAALCQWNALKDVNWQVIQGDDE